MTTTILQSQAIKQAIKAAFNNQDKEWRNFLISNVKNDAHALLRLGKTTREVAYHLGIDAKRAKRLLDKAHKAKAVIKYTKLGSYCTWWYPGLLNELKQEQEQQ